jgi:centrosomal protein CEP104
MGGTGSKAASRTPASGHPNRQAAAGSQQQRPKQQQQAPRQQQQHAQPPAQEQQVLAGLEAEDPAPFMAELTAREQQYGPNHPAVAESCSNLAILFNQKGDYGAALPLYERALAIYEANYGPSHQEVAHTLTDLAVLHLEQVRLTGVRPAQP